MNDIVDTKKASLRLLNNEVLEIKLKSNNIIEIDDAKAQYQVLTELTKSLDQYCLLVYADKTTSVTNEAREFSANPKLKKGLKAEAIITDHLPNFIMSKIYTRLFKPTVPIRLFREEAKAIEWLSNYCQADL